VPPLIGLVHRTSYRYDRPVRLGPQSIRLRPMPHARTPIPSYALRIGPEPASLHWQQDPHGNSLARAVLPGPIDAMDVVVDLVADLAPQDPFNFLLDPGAESWPFRYEPLMADDLGQFRRTDHAGPLLQGLRDETPPSGMPTVGLILELTHRVRNRVAYIVRMESGVWNPDRTLAEARGSCRDSAWLLIQLLRLHGVAARFVSGYLIQLPDDGTPDVADLHAWAEAFLPGAGWIGLDATSGLLTAEGHIPLAASPHPIAAAPITGTVEPSGVVLETDMQLRHVAPRAAA